MRKYHRLVIIYVKAILRRAGRKMKLQEKVTRVPVIWHLSDDHTVIAYPDRRYAIGSDYPDGVEPCDLCAVITSESITIYYGSRRVARVAIRKRSLLKV